MASTSKVKKSSLLASSLVVSSMTFISRIAGLARDIVIASLAGAGGAADAFFIAFKIPNFLRRLFAEGAFNQAFVPVLSEYAHKKSQAEVRLLINSVAGCLGLSLLVVTLVAMLAAPLLVWVFAPGFAADPAKQALTADLLRLTFPYLLLISLTAFASGILNTWGRFALPAVTPVLLNLSLIGSAFWLTPLLPTAAHALAWGVVIAGVLQLGVQLPALGKLGLLPLPKPNWQHEGVKKILKLMAPAVFGVSVSQINLLLDTVLASFLADGSVGWLYYSDRLVELPLGVFGVALATVVLPSLSKGYAAEDTSKFSGLLNWALRWVLLIGLPATLGLVFLAQPLLITLFHYGAMTSQDILMSSKSLQAYALGLLAFMLIKVLAPGYFARQDTATPVKIGIIAMVANMVFNLVLIWPLAHVGLALATSASAFLNAYLLARGLVKLNLLQFNAQWLGFLARLAVALLVLFGVLWLLTPEVNFWLEASLSQRLVKLSLLLAAALVSYFASLLILKTPLNLRYQP